MRLRHIDSSALDSPWSDVLTVTSQAIDESDTNGDGLTDSLEVAGPTDVNQNGVPDESEGIVAFHDTESGGIFGIAIQDGTLERLHGYAVDDPRGSDGNVVVRFVFGALGLRVKAVRTGVATNTVTVILYAPAAPAAANPWRALDGAIDVAQTLDGQVVTFSVEDGGAGDQDGVRNGIIVHNGALAETASNGSDTTPSPAPDGDAAAPPSGDSGGGGVLFGLLFMVGIGLSIRHLGAH